MSSKSVICALGVVLGACLAGPALAEPQEDIRLSFAYDPDAVAGDIYGELRRAASEACRVDATAALAIPAFREERICQKELMDAAVKAMGRRDIARLHRRAPEAATVLADR